MRRDPIDRNKCDFLFRFGRYAWRETYWDGIANSLVATMKKAKDLAPLRIAMFGTDNTPGGSPFLSRIIVSNDSIGGDSEEDFSFAYKTPSLAAAWLGNFAAPPNFAMMWRTTNNTGFGRTRYLSGIAVPLLGLIAPHLNATMIAQFNKFKKQLSVDSWAYLLTGGGPNKNPDHKVTFIGPPVGTSVQVWSPILPQAGQMVELRYARFNKGTPPVRGFYKVNDVFGGSFSVTVGPLAPSVSYRSGGIWRTPATRVINFDGSALMTGITNHERGYKTYSERGRSRRRAALVF